MEGLKLVLSTDYEEMLSAHRPSFLIYDIDLSAKITLKLNLILILAMYMEIHFLMSEQSDESSCQCFSILKPRCFIHPLQEED